VPERVTVPPEVNVPSLDDLTKTPELVQAVLERLEITTPPEWVLAARRADIKMKPAVDPLTPIELVELLAPEAVYPVVVKPEDVPN
jgi:hypothetical protein